MPPLPDEKWLTEDFVSIRGFKLRLRLWGDTSKPLVLLQHGGKDHGRSWDWTVAALMDDYCCAVPDLRGHGDSDWPAGGEYESIDMVSDMAFIAEALQEKGFAEPFRLIGHSLGGNIALNFTAAQPQRIRSVISIEGLGFSQKTYDQIQEKPAAERMQEAISRKLKTVNRTRQAFKTEDEAVDRLAAVHKDLDPAQVQHLARHGLEKSDEGFRWKHDPILGFTPVRPMPPSEYAQTFASIEQPMLLMYGKNSWAQSPATDGRLESLQNAELIEFEGAGHWLHHDHFDDFITASRKFLGAH